MATIPADLSLYATQASKQTGLNPLVILTQWIAENGWKVPKGYNFGNIMKPGGNHILETYATPEAGVTAYANFLKNNSNYKGILATAGKSDAVQLNAIIASPWEETHYNNGKNLIPVYNTVANASIAVPTGAAVTAAPMGVPNQLSSLQSALNPTDTGWAAQAGSIGLMVLLAVLGLGLIFFGIKLISGGAAATIIQEGVTAK